MAAYKDKGKGTWYVSFYYQNWKGERERKLKRGFGTKREALEWELEFKKNRSTDLDMTFESFVDIYGNDMRPRLKQNTWLTKDHIIREKLLPAFRTKKMCEIRPADVIQ